MRTLFLFLAATALLVSCSGNSASTTTESKDSTSTKDTTSSAPDGAVTPPASNGQF